MKLGILIKQDFKNLITNRSILIFCTIFPITLVLLFGFLFSSLYDKSVTAYDYYGITMMFYMVIYCVTITPNTFMEERIKQANLRIAYSPVSRVQIYMSKLISSFMFMAIAFIIDMLFFKFSGIVNYGSQFIYILILNLSLLLFSVTLGGAVCVIIRSEKITNKALSLIINIISLFSGIFFQIDGLGKWAQNISNFSPLKWVIDSSFKIIYDNFYEGFSSIIIGLVALSIIFTIIVHFNYRQEDYI